MSFAHFLKIGRFGWLIRSFVLALMVTAADVHAAAAHSVVPEEAVHSPGTPSSLALLATGLAFLVIIRRHYRLR
jgi:hypothetical protein